MPRNQKLYSIYLSRFAVELRDQEKGCFGSAELVSSQSSYANGLKFAQDFARNQEMSLQNYAQFEVRYEY